MHDPDRTTPAVVAFLFLAVPDYGFTVWVAVHSHTAKATKSMTTGIVRIGGADSQSHTLEGRAAGHRRAINPCH